MDTPSLVGIVADDDFAVLYLAVTLLRMGGYEVLPARDGGEALQLLEQHRSHVRFLITDLQMPIMDGIELARIVRTRFPTVGVVLMSGGAIPDNASVGAHALLHKPFTSATLVESVRNALAAIGRD